MKYYLGISCYFHDSSIALLNENGDLIDFKKEEYFSRVKGDKSFPRLALEEIINNFNLDDESILKVTFYEKESDIKFSALARKIFDSELPLDKKMHLRYFVEKIDRICDQAEDIADEIQIYAIKRSI